MARPVGGRLSEAFKEAYLAAGLTQLDVEAGLHERGFTNIDQPLVSKWARGMRQIPLDVLPALDDICGHRKGYILRAAGYVDPFEDDGVEAAIKADPQLTARYKRDVLSFLAYARSESAEKVRQ
jgi:transcriptional regulator with XRE-family HTH domain